jgi:hypothetical protein
MAITDEQFQAIVVLIEDGELDDRMLELQQTIDNSGGGGAGFSPVPDPMSESGGSDPFGDGNPDVVSTGAQIG